MGHWAWDELNALPRSFWDLLAAIFRGIENGGEWPPALLYAYVALLPKAGQDATEAGPTKLRPITVAFATSRSDTTTHHVLVLGLLCPYI